MSNRSSAIRRPPFAILGIAVLALAAAACASRALPASFPVSAAASPSAAPAPPARVGVALAEDPPLPGEPAARWPGIEGDRSAQAHNHHHHGAPDGGMGGSHAR